MAKKKGSKRKCSTFKDYVAQDCSHTGKSGAFRGIWLGGYHPQDHDISGNGSSTGSDAGSTDAGGGMGESFNPLVSQRVKRGAFSQNRSNWLAGGWGHHHDWNHDTDSGGDFGGGDGGGGGEGEEIIDDEDCCCSGGEKWKTRKIKVPGRFTMLRRQDQSTDDPNFEEDEEGDSKKSQARQLYQQLRGQGVPRKEIIAMFQQRIGLTDSSAVAYYERIAKEFGETEHQGGGAGGPGGPGGMGAGGPGDGFGQYGMPGQGGHHTEFGMDQDAAKQENEVQEWEDGNRQGAIRRVKNAHLVYKRQQDDGSFKELWVYKQGDRTADELDTRRDILAGTDIPPQKTKSPDGRQTANVWSSGNVQFLEIEGLPN